MPWEIENKSWRKSVGMHAWRSAGVDRESGMKATGRD